MKFITSEVNNIIYSDISNAFGQYDFKNLFVFDFMTDRINEVFYSNTNYTDLQIKSSITYNKIIKYVSVIILIQAYEESIENNQKKVKISHIKKELNSNHQELFSKISNLQVYYENTADLILDFLNAN